MLLILSCGKHTVDSNDKPKATIHNIYNGKKVKAGEIIEKVAVYLEVTDKSGEVNICSGTVVGPKAVLTNSHCLDTAESVKVNFGQDGNNPYKVINALDNWKIQTDYDSDADYDIALIELEEEVPARVIQVNIAASNMVLGVDPYNNLWTYGYGINRAFVDKSTWDGGILRKTKLNCKNLSNDEFSAQRVCKSSWTQASKAITQGGDSGGGSIIRKNHKWFLIGLTWGGVDKTPDKSLWDTRQIAVAKVREIISYMNKDCKLIINNLPCMGAILDVNEPNQKASHATVFQIPNTPLRPSLSKNDQDWYSIQINKDLDFDLEILFSHSEANIDIELYHPDAKTMITSSTSATDDEKITAFLAPGKYFIRVFGSNFNTSFADYIFKFSKFGCISGSCDNGAGLYLWRNGNKYQGQWKNGKQHGSGVFSWSNGSVSYGDYKDGKRSGFGSYETAEHTYLGEYLNDRQHGFGALISKDTENIFMGTFVDGEMMGPGSQYLLGGQVYKGMWKNNQHVKDNHTKDIKLPKMSGCLAGDCWGGLGLQLDQTGQIKIGNFKTGRFHGVGLMVTKSDVAHFGQWSDGKFVIPTPTPAPKMKLP